MLLGKYELCLSNLWNGELGLASTTNTQVCSSKGTCDSPHMQVGPSIGSMAEYSLQRTNNNDLREGQVLSLQNDRKDEKYGPWICPVPT